MIVLHKKATVPTSNSESFGQLLAQRLSKRQQAITSVWHPEPKGIGSDNDEPFINRSARCRL
jgi:hypothetical protein